MIFRCKCGEEFAKRMHLKEHIGLLNPHWPRVRDDDEHAIVIERTSHGQQA